MYIIFILVKQRNEKCLINTHLRSCLAYFVFLFLIFLVGLFFQSYHFFSSKDLVLLFTVLSSVYYNDTNNSIFLYSSKITFFIQEKTNYLLSTLYGGVIICKRSSFTFLYGKNILIYAQRIMKVKQSKAE
jgi:hypothetical protein